MELILEAAEPVVPAPEAARLVAVEPAAALRAVPEAVAAEVLAVVAVQHQRLRQ